MLRTREEIWISVNKIDPIARAMGVASKVQDARRQTAILEVLLDIRDELIELNRIEIINNPKDNNGNI